MDDWTQKSTYGRRTVPTVAIDEILIRLSDQRCRPYVLTETVLVVARKRALVNGVDSDTVRLLAAGFSSTRTRALSAMFRGEFRKGGRIDGAPWLPAACHRLGSGSNT